MRGMIVAVSPEGVIGLDGKIPWHYKADLQRFKRLTMGSTIVMGRLTWESLKRPLPGRRNVVVTSHVIEVPGVECYRDLAGAVASATGDVWFIGGARVYEEAMRYADVIDMTLVPDHVDHPDAVRFPPIDPALFEEGETVPHEDDPALRRRVYKRKGSA